VILNPALIDGRFPCVIMEKLSNVKTLKNAVNGAQFNDLPPL
jgi:hypothetical protein